MFARFKSKIRPWEQETVVCVFFFFPALGSALSSIIKQWVNGQNGVCVLYQKVKVTEINEEIKTVIIYSTVDTTVKPDPVSSNYYVY